MHHSGAFKSLSFPKQGHEIVEKAHLKVKELSEKLQERERRVQALVDKLGPVSTTTLLLRTRELLSPQYSNTGGLTAGDQAAIQEELGKIEQGKGEVEKLGYVLRNLPKGETFRLTFDELEYFGF